MLEESSEEFMLALISDGHYIMQMNKYRKLGLKRYIKYPVFTDLYQTKKPDEKPYKMVMDYFPECKTFIYVSDNPKKDFISPKKLGWRTVRYKNPAGIYKDVQNSAECETDDRNEILSLVKRVCG
jgi:putative hydrolase of the HAD superfamily